MVRGRALAWATAGFLGCTALTGVWTPDSAVAQSREAPGAGRDLGRFSTTVRPAPGQPRRSGGPSPVGDPGPTPDPAGADPDRTGDPTVEGDEPARQLPPGAGRRVPVDGDPNWPPQPVQPVDGVIETQTPEQPVDGGDPTQVDTRPTEEFSPFEMPASGELPPADLNPEAFQIELEPILSRRPAQLARFEPFAPVGIRRGSFIIFPEAEISVVALDNLFRSTSNARRDVALDVRPTVRVASAWTRHAVEFRATGLSTFHNHFPSEDDRNWGVEARGRIDITRRTNVEVFSAYEIAQEKRGSLDAASRLGDRADIATTRAGVNLNHRFNRLSIQIRGTITETDYSPTTSDTGVLALNTERDATTKEVAVRGTWDFKPTLAAFSEVAFNHRTYGGVPADGVTRESHGERVRFGISFGNTSRRLRGEASVGYGTQRFEDSRLPEIRGVIIDSNLAWRLSGLTSLLVTAKTDVGESTQAGSGGALSRTAGVELRHEFQRRLIGTAGLRFTRQDYEGVDLSERELAALASLEYTVNREVTLFGRYQHIEFDSTEAARNYNADELRVGVRVRR